MSFSARRSTCEMNSARWSFQWRSAKKQSVTHTAEQRREKAEGEVVRRERKRFGTLYVPPK
eukprot:6164503-Prymnesium_polylepis.1